MALREFIDNQPDSFTRSLASSAKAEIANNNTIRLLFVNNVATTAFEQIKTNALSNFRAIFGNPELQFDITIDEQSQSQRKLSPRDEALAKLYQTNTTFKLLIEKLNLDL